MGTDTTWIDGEIFALAGFDHDEADIIRLTLCGRVTHFQETS